MKVMLLAAGLGTRLKPLTLKTPKPIIPVNQLPLIFYNLGLLKKYGFSEIIINLFYLGNQIKELLGTGKKFGFKFHYSEEPEILGTGGGIRFAQKFYKEENLLVINSDIIHDINIEKLIKTHIKTSSLATLAVQDLPPDQSYSALNLDKKDQIVSILDQPQVYKNSRKTFFTGIHVLSSNAVEMISENDPQCIVRDLYIPQLRLGQKLQGYLDSGYWNDLGTLDRLHETEIKLKSGEIKLSYEDYLLEFKKILDES